MPLFLAAEFTFFVPPLTFKMSRFVRWYITKLKTRPVVTNLTSSLVLMGVGDILAQEMEQRHVGDSPESKTVPLKRRLSLRHYSTHRNHGGEGDPSAGSQFDEARRPSTLCDDGCRSTSEHYLATAQIVWEELRCKIESIDGLRTATMAAWAAGFMTPFWMVVYRGFDRVFPVKPPASVIARVVGSLIASIPVNMAFFVYGTSVHHSVEWLALRSEWREELQELELVGSEIGAIMDRGPPFDWEMMLSKSELKVRTELLNTMVTSAKAWIPINFFNFALVPPHLRPLVLGICSCGWNCYLSLVQHRDLTLPTE